MKIRRIVGKVLRGAFACAMGCIGLIGVAGCGSDDDVATYYGPPPSPSCDDAGDAFKTVCSGDAASEEFAACVKKYKESIGCDAKEKEDEVAVYYGPAATPQCDDDDDAFKTVCSGDAASEEFAACVKKYKESIGCGRNEYEPTYYGPPPACDSDDDAFWQVCNGDKASEAFRTCVDRYKKDLGCDENAVYYGPPSCTDENAFEQACANETDEEKRAACIKKMKQQAGCEEDEQ